MKNWLVALAIFAISLNLQALELDVGGVSVDFSRVGSEANLQGPNLLADPSFEAAADSPWYTGVHVHRETPKDGDPLEVRLKELVSFGTGNGAATITAPRSAYDDDPDHMPLFSAYYSQIVEIEPSDKNAVYVLTYRYRGHLETDLPNAILNASLVCLDAKGASATDATLVNVTPHDRWQTGAAEILAPPATRRVRVLLRLYGAGDVSFDDVSLQLRHLDRGVTVRGLPFSFVDNTFYLSQGAPGILVFGLRNETGMAIAQPRLKLWLPSGFDLLAVQKNLRILESVDEVGGTVHTIDLSSLRTDIKAESYSSWNAPALTIRSRFIAGPDLYPARYWYEDGDYRSDVLDFTLKILPPITVKPPARFRSGGVLSRETDVSDVGAAARLADHYLELGFNSVHTHDHPFSRAASERGIFRYEQPIWLCNGYRLGEAPKSDDIRFQFADGTYQTEGRFQAICPVEVISRGPYFRDHIKAPLHKMIVEDRSADSIMPNWEPYMFDYRGCFCPRCKEQFITHSKLSREAVEAAWPRDILVKYRELWTAFRSWQHGQMVTTLEETIAALGKEAGVDAHFIPEIAWDALTPRGAAGEDRNQVRVADYMENLPWLEPWGPYNFQPFLKRYAYNPGCHLSVFAAAKAQKQYLADTIADPSRRPSLIAFPHAFQGEDWITEPEALAFETLCFFVNGWEGSLAYRFPRGYDARWWRALAQVNSLAARYEAFTLDGKRASHTLIPLTPLPGGPRFRAELDSSRVLRILPEVQKMSLVQSVEWRLGKRRLIAIGNAWEHGEAFVRLNLQDLGFFGAYAVWQPHENRHFASPSGDAEWTTGELHDGILLHVGALRYTFLVVEPYVDDADYGQAISVAEMEAALTERLPRIQAAVANDQAYLDDQRQAEIEAGSVPDLSTLSPLSQDGMSLEIATWPGVETPCIILQQGKEQTVIDPAKGARITSWRISGVETVHQSPDLGLAVDAVWWPSQAAAMFNQVYQPTGQTLSDDTLSVTFERQIGAESAGLKGCSLHKRISMTRGQSGFTVTTELTNTTTADIRFAFRYHNMISPLELRNNQRGWGTLTTRDGAIRFERDFIKRFYRAVDTADKELEGAFQMEQVLVISEPHVTFGAPWLPFAPRAQFIGDLYGICFWDSGKQACSTFEPIWQRQELPPAKTWQASIRFSAE